MTGVFKSLELFVLSCFFLIVGSQTGQILPPENVTLQWITPFRPQLSWTSPRSAENCTYTCKKFETNINEAEQDLNVRSPWSTHLQLNNENWWLSVETVCGDKRSEPVNVSISYPGIVKDLQCTIHSSKETHCSWLPVSGVRDLVFSYGFVNEDRSVSSEDERFPSLQECSLYSDTDGGRTGCVLQANITQAIFILFNGTLENKPVRSTFKQFFKVRPPPLNWTVVKSGTKFDISWIPPDIGQLSDWEFIIKYTECGQIKNKSREGVTRTDLGLVSHCQYCMSIQAQRNKGGQTPWTDQKCFDADPNPLVYIAIVIPLMVAGLAVLTFVFCRKNKDSIFPKVPEPRDFLSDISDNNNKCNVRNLYVPAEEEEACKITLVIDPQNNKHDF